MPVPLGPILHERDVDHVDHLELARRVLALPIEASGMHWHPFGLYTIPMAKTTVGEQRWSRRLHIWHPQAKPVGPASPYGVHTHSGDATSHVLVGALEHHLYAFTPAEGGVWLEMPTDGGRRADLSAHVHATTHAGVSHRLPADQPHGVSKGEGWAVSLFEQADVRGALPFTTWQRQDVPAEELVRIGPVAVDAVRQQALMHIEQALFAAQSGAEPDSSPSPVAPV